MSRIAFLVMMGMASVAWGQMSFEEAMERMRLRQQARALLEMRRAATTQPTTRPVVAPDSDVAKGLALLEADRLREAYAAAALSNRGEDEKVKFPAGVFVGPYSPIQRVSAPNVFGINPGSSRRASAAGPGEVYVRGYYRNDGTYVRSHWRTRPDGIKSNNRSYRGR